MEKIIKKEEFLKNGLIYTRLSLENGTIKWFANTTLNILSNSHSLTLEADFQAEYPPLEKEVD
jgi:hypothetical protein